MTLKHFTYSSFTLLVTLLLLTGCTPEDQVSQMTEEAPMQMAPPVTLVTVETQTFTNSIKLPGRIVPRRIAEVRARVAGIVLQRHFKEGSLVNPEQPLFSIEPATYEAEVAKEKASLAKAEANLVLYWRRKPP